MKRLPYVLVLASAASFLACGTHMVEFKSPDGVFSVKFPGEPVMKPSHAGTMYVLTSDGVNYQVGITAVPAEFQDPVTAEHMFDEMAKSLIGSESTARAQRHLTLGPKAYLGREVTIQRKNASGEIEVTGRAYRIGHNLYTLTVYAPAAKASSPFIQQFFDSFTVLNEPA